MRERVVGRLAVLANGLALVAPGVVGTTEVELGMSCCWSGGSDGQAGLDETAVYEVAAVLDVP